MGKPKGEKYICDSNFNMLKKSFTFSFLREGEQLRPIFRIVAIVSVNGETSTGTSVVDGHSNSAI